MKSMKVIKKVLGVLVLGALVSLLPMFAVDVKADGALDVPEIYKSDGSRAVVAEDYRIAIKNIELLTNNLTIKNPYGKNCTDFTITSLCDEPDLTYTLDNITFNGDEDTVPLYFEDKKVTLKIKGECNIQSSSVGIWGTDLTIVGFEDSTENALNINIRDDCNYRNYGICVSKCIRNNGIYIYMKMIAN